MNWADKPPRIDKRMVSTTGQTPIPFVMTTANVISQPLEGVNELPMTMQANTNMLNVNNVVNLNNMSQQQYNEALPSPYGSYLQYVRMFNV